MDDEDPFERFSSLCVMCNICSDGSRKILLKCGHVYHEHCLLGRLPQDPLGCYACRDGLKMDDEDPFERFSTLCVMCENCSDGSRKILLKCGHVYHEHCLLGRLPRDHLGCYACRDRRR